MYSPRTTLNKVRESDSILINQIIKHFDPFTVNFLKRDFELNYGSHFCVVVGISVHLVCAMTAEASTVPALFRSTEMCHL